jgi:hypothetical protein
VPGLVYGQLRDIDLESLRCGPSTILGEDHRPVQAIREGVVVKAAHEDMRPRRVLKCINDEYYLRDQTDFH